MIKVLGSNRICFVGSIEEIQKQLSSVHDKSITLAEYIKQQWLLNKQSLN